MKNPERLIRAWNSKYGKLLMVGSGQLENNLITLIEELGLSDCIKIQSETEDIGSVLSKAQALIISSDREGSPKVLYESLYCKVPVLSTNCGNIGDVLPKECVADANDESFKLLIKKWMGKVDELSSIQNDCFDNIVSNNLLSIQTQKVIEKYQEFLSMASK